VIDCDFSRLSSVQIDALTNVAFGGDGAGCGPRTLEALERRRLIESTPAETPTPLGMLRFKRWHMPLPVHIEFCAWAASKETGQ
jgi:hypothetical protein